MIPFMEDRELSEHLRSLQPPSTRPQRPVRRSKPTGIYSGMISSIYQAGYAFVRPDIHHDGLARDDDLFAHKSRMQPGLSQGDRCTYNVRELKRRSGTIEAVDVRRAA